MKNKHLKSLAKSLKTNYLVEFRDNNILELSVDKNILPSALLICEDEEIIFIYISCELNNKRFESQLLDYCNKQTESLIVGNFYFSNTGIIHFDEEAEKYYTLEQVIDLEILEPFSPLQH